jgi:glycosyltransferase involved in cell wall biosynthesis
VPEPPILLVHNGYQHPGGEDEVVRAEAALLRSNGHDLREYRLHNDSIGGMSTAKLVTATMWNSAAHRDLMKILATLQGGVAHFHNTFPLVSPAGYYAARRRGVAVVQTLHNYRLLCPNALFFRSGAMCEQCLGKRVPWPAVVHGCYRGSRAASAAVAGMLTLHRAVGTWDRQVDVYIALTEFARSKFIDGGIAPEKIVVVPNFADDPGVGQHRERSVVFVGRLTHEKGVQILLDAWYLLTCRQPGLTLKIVGDGPLATLQRAAPPGVVWLGRQSHDRVMQIMKDAAVLVFPSSWPEGFPMTLIEAFATGLPVIASRLGSIREVIHDGYSGRLFTADDPADLADALQQILEDDTKRQQLGDAARSEFEAKYTPARHYALLLRAYAMAAKRASASATPGTT